MTSTTETLPFADPSIRWYVKPSLNHGRMIKTTSPTADSIGESCDDAICFPRIYNSFLMWYDPTYDNIGIRMFDLEEAWDHLNRDGPDTSYPYNGRAILIPGYGGYFLAVHLTDRSNIIQVNIIRRYLDNTILIYNTGKYGNTSYNISVNVYNPIVSYNIDTNGTSSSSWTTLAPGQYVLFYKDTKPVVDTGNGLFSKSPFGTSKSQPYELWTNAFTHTTYKINIPRMYLGVKAPADMEVISNGAYPGAHSTYIPSGTSGGYDYPLCGMGGQEELFDINYNLLNVSHMINSPYPHPMICKEDPNNTMWDHGNHPFKAWFGWGENESGNVKFILLSLFNISVNTDFIEELRTYTAYIYDVERNEAYATTIIKPTINFYSFGENSSCPKPYFSPITDVGYGSAFAYIDANDVWNKKTDAPLVRVYHDNAYGFCNYYSDKIICGEGLGIYTTDTGYAPPPPKSAFGATRTYGRIDALAIRVPSLGDRYLYAGKIYAVATRLKTFPATASDTEIQNWFKSLQPKSLTSEDYNRILRVLPGSFWLFGNNTDMASITAPSSINAGSQFTTIVSCPAKPNTPIWVALVDGNGNIAASNSGTTDGSGNASIALTAPNTPGTYRVLAIIKGSRQLI